ncbi:amidase [Pararhodobacter zhoushanensis]|uniref:amidase n=1 Tax=Pararhodobacter zhoushanensis TaxID=2479545 RepID=UPI000F8EFBA7|nr:amidase [Pararhodobacter zhoushanensis]
MSLRPTVAKHALVAPLDLGGDGLRVVVKDCIDIAGYATRCGSRAFDDAVPADRHADVVQALLNAGCRITGKTNMHELAYGMTGVNEAYGTPVNPHWPDRIPGGSSSGSAVAVAAGICDFGVGTDTGGSVRQPAICCGVYGIKPTYGRISRRGLSPATSSLDCVGAFARDMDMLIAAMQAMDPSFARVTLTAAPRLARIKAELDDEVGQALVYALMEGAPEVDYVTLPSLEAAFAAGMTVIGAETVAAFGHLLDEGAPLGADIRARLTASRAITPDQLAQAEAVRAAFTAEVDAVLATAEALITPALPMVPPTLTEAQDPKTVLPLTRFLRPFNLSGHPAIVIPSRRPSDGLPVGLQLVGRKNDDARLCAIAKWLAESLPAFKEKDAV